MEAQVMRAAVGTLRRRQHERGRARDRSNLRRPVPRGGTATVTRSGKESKFGRTKPPTANDSSLFADGTAVRRRSIGRSS